MKPGWIIGGGFLAVIVIALLTIVGTSNGLATKEQAVKASASQVLNLYKRRADLTDNLVETVKGYAGHENSTLTQVTQARAAATQPTIGKDLATDPEAMKRFMENQGQLGAALGRLMMLREAYPNLKADRHFSDLQKQLEGTENRLAVARQDYIKQIQGFNTALRVFPGNMINAMMLGYQPFPDYSIDDADLAKPKVRFGAAS